MRKNLTIICLLMFSGLFLHAQHDGNILQNLLTFQKGHKYVAEPVAMTTQDPFNLCQALYEWDDAITNFKKIGTNEIIYDIVNGQDVFTIEGEVSSDEGVQKFKVISYGGFNDVFANEDLNAENGDSVIVFAEIPGGDLAPLIKIYNTFDQGRIVLSEQYFDFSLIFGIPLGFLLAGTTEYRYNDENRLSNKVTNSLDFFTGEMAIVDSTVFRYNGLGQMGEEKVFNLDENGVFYLAEKTLITFNADGLEETETEFMYDVDGTEVNKTKASFSYDNQGRQIELIAETFDYGTEAFVFDSKTLSEFAKELPLGFPTRQLFQVYFNNQWENSDMSITDLCGTSQINPTEIADLKVWMTGNTLQISGFEGFSDQAHLNLIDLSGRIVFVSKGKLKSQYDLGLTTSGLYILEVRDQNNSVSKKLFIQS